MIQLDMFEELKPKAQEIPNANLLQQDVFDVKTAVQQQWNITYRVDPLLQQTNPEVFVGRFTLN